MKTANSKKGRKIGRNLKSPAQMRYNNEQRWNKNKRRRVQKEANRTGQEIFCKIAGVETIIKPKGI